ncbi:MAG: LytTR family DNA-binding domain-containing protein, partial [Niameybacter sp.]
KIIFVTALEQYWPEGYTVNAYRYIIKPIDERTFYQLVSDWLKEINQNKRSVLLKKGEGIENVLIADIKYLAIEDRKVVVYTRAGRYDSRVPLSQWEEKLYTHHFANSHTSYLVNLKFVKSIDKEHVTLIDGEQVYVSQRKYKAFKNKLIAYIDTIS